MPKPSVPIINITHVKNRDSLSIERQNTKIRNQSWQSFDSNFSKRLHTLRRMSKFRKSLFGNPIRKELRAQKTLTIALIVFLGSYFPLFTYLTLASFSELFRTSNNQINHGNLSEWFSAKSINIKISTMDLIFYMTTWLGYSSAAINPFLQFFLNNNLKKAFKSCLRRKNK